MGSKEFQTKYYIKSQKQLETWADDKFDEELPGSSWQACPARGWGSARPPPSCSTSHLKMQSNVSQEIQRDFRSHKSIAATLTNPFSKILTKPGVRRLFHTLLPLPLLLDELSAPNSLSMFQAKGCERTNDFI